MITVIVTGEGGQLASELKATLPNTVNAHFFDVESLDITDTESVFERVRKINPDFIINAAAYTAVDKAESESDLAFAVNEKGSENLALACKEFKAKLIHISTDFVFSGDKATPYLPNDATAPLSVYGASKLAGEQKITNILTNEACIIRTAWVYSAFGNNFVKTMLRLMQEKEQLGVISDQIGTPTWAKGLANLVWKLVIDFANKNFNSSIMHWTDAGCASWYDFAVSIQELAIEKGLLTKDISIQPICTSSYPTPATRPSYSLLDKTSTVEMSGLPALHWRKQLSLMLDEIANNNNE